jgi:hypothetical protein
MSSITTTFAAALTAVDRPGDFFTAGTQEMAAPRLDVERVGPIALPLLPMQAEQLIATAERAPYGRGEETLTDPEVRRTWQITPDRVRLGGRHWPKTFDTILARVTEGLGVTGKVEARLYKLLIYDQGSFFMRHRDTEKAKGMFATLIVVVPSLSAGGELVVKHKDREARLDLRCEEPSDIAFAAFYADCVHEVLPVTEVTGWLWSLISCAPAEVPCPSRRIMPRRRMPSRDCCGNGLKPSDCPPVANPKN